MKTYTTHFFQATPLNLPVGVNADDYIFQLFTDEITRLQNGGDYRILKSTSTGRSFELRELTEVGNTIQGCLASLRDDAPHLRDLEGVEHPVTINTGDQFMEKNFFIYFKERRILCWQFNLMANHIRNMDEAVIDLSGNTQAVVFSYLLDDAFGFDPATSEIKYIDLRVKRPDTKAEHLDVESMNPNEWGVDIFRGMEKSGAREASLVLQTRKQDGQLASWVTRMAGALLGSGQTRKLKVSLVGAEEPIDLLAKRIKSKINVRMDGLYPVKQSIFEELQRAKDRCNDLIQANY